MALFNGGFPATYPQVFPQYQQGYQMPQYQPVQNVPQQQIQQTGMTPPTVHADIVQVSGEQEAAFLFHKKTFKIGIFLKKVVDKVFVRVYNIDMIKQGGNKK